MAKDPLDFLDSESSDPLNFLEEKKPSTFRSILSAPIKGALRTASTINPFAAPGPVPQEMGTKILEELLPSLPEHKVLERVGEIGSLAALGPEALPEKLLQTLGGTLGGELAEKGGLGETGQIISETLGMGLPGLTKGLVKRGIEAVTKPALKTESGLTKLKATEAKFPKLGTLSKEREEIVTQKLDKEASKLAKATLEKHLPITKEIEKGTDFENNFKIGFQNIKKAAEESGTLPVNTSPLDEFLSKTAQEYKGLPTPHEDAAKILKEIKNFQKRPQKTMQNLLKIYRSNNKKQRRIFETAHVTGKQEEFSDFLTAMNESIAKSFEKTLPENSEWMNQFRKYNRDYKNYKSALKTQEQLKGILSAEPKYSEIEKLSKDVRTQAKLSLSMGENGAKEVIQIAKDLKNVKDAIKTIPKSQLQKFDAYFPIAFFIPYAGKILGLGLGIKSSIKLGRYAYGWLLSTPSRRGIYREAINSLIKNDLTGYQKAVSRIKKEMQSEES